MLFPPDPLAEGKVCTIDTVSHEFHLSMPPDIPVYRWDDLVSKVCDLAKSGGLLAGYVFVNREDGSHERVAAFKATDKLTIRHLIEQNIISQIRLTHEHREYMAQITTSL